jgi:hypothetical protein
MAEDHLGVMVGDPTGLSYLHSVNAQEAFSVGVGINFIDNDNDALHAHVDWVHRFAPVADGHIRFYVGLGVFGEYRDVDNEGIGNDDDDEEVDAGPRVPLGFEWRIDSRSDWHLFFEVAPGVDVVEDVDGSMDAALGLRFRL